MKSIKISTPNCLLNILLPSLINSKKRGRQINSGFTLIELLAVIVIIAVISLITIPLILNIVEKSEKNAFVDSAYGIIEAGKLYYMENVNEKDTVSRVNFKVNNQKFVLESDETKELKFSGKMPKSGMLQVHANGDVAVAICNKDYCACKSITELKVNLKDNNCNINSETGEIGEDKAEDRAPVGTVISYMAGDKAPEGYLACDGKVYNINDYKILADAIKEGFGSYNYYGGNGTTTFAVPDLSGEFLRGAGTNNHTNQGGGANVGKHQDATELARIWNWENKAIVLDVGSYNWDQTNYDHEIATPGNRYKYELPMQQTNGTGTVRTTRPTNTSVLYCIKY